MNLVGKARSYITNLFLKSIPMVENTEIGLMDVYLEKIIGILVWKSKEQTLKIFFLLNTFFWIILMLNMKLYGIISVIGLYTFIYDMWWRETLYLEFKGDYSDLVGSIKNAFVKLTNIFKVLRRDSPLMFSSSMALFFLTIRIVSSSISGHILTYLLFFITFFVPVCFKMLPESVTVRMQSFIDTLNTHTHSILAEDELIPFIQGNDFGRQDADLESLLTDRTADSITNSLASGISTMPSYLEVAGTPCDIEEDDLLPRAGSRGVSLTPGELSSDSDSDHREIRFDSDHFNTSSSEDDPYSKNLNFPKDVKDSGKEDVGIRNMISSVMASVSGNIVSNMFQSALYNKTPVKKLNSESDSDFEIVEPDDIADDFSSRS